MAPDDEADDLPLGRPLPAEDRLWRHPSEMHAQGDSPQIVLVERTSPSIGRTLTVAVLAGLLGAGATLTVALGTDVLVRERPGTTSHEVRDGSPGAAGDNELAIANRVLDSVAHLETTGSNGSVNATAVVFRSDGQLITTAHAVDAASRITLVLPDGRRFTTPDVVVVGKSTAADVAVLKIPVDGLPPAAGVKGPAQRWETTVVVDASPVTKGPSIGVGVVTREVAEARAARNETMFGLIETATRANLGELGPGTVFLNDAGSVVGLVTDRPEIPGATPLVATSTTKTGARPVSPVATAAPAPVSDGSGSGSGDGNSLHYAVPADYAWDVAAQLADTGHVVKPWVGVPAGDAITVDEANRDQFVGGMRVTMVEDGSPARQAGLQVGDVIIALETDNVTGYNSFVTALRRHPVGAEVKLRVLRKADYDTKYLTVGGRLEQ
jgi:S1-C subfamily serine protease